MNYPYVPPKREPPSPFSENDIAEAYTDLADELLRVGHHDPEGVMAHVARRDAEARTPLQRRAFRSYLRWARHNVFSVGIDVPEPPSSTSAEAAARGRAEDENRYR